MKYQCISIMYSSLRAVDSTRVVLDDPENDYINANFVKVRKGGGNFEISFKFDM